VVVSVLPAWAADTTVDIPAVPEGGSLVLGSFRGTVTLDPGARIVVPFSVDAAPANSAQLHLWLTSLTPDCEH
jgi:hypothetical protein